jgi:hypothetical protein
MQELKQEISSGTIFDQVDLDVYNGVTYRLWLEWNDGMTSTSSDTFWYRGLNASIMKKHLIQDLHGPGPILQMYVYGSDLRSWFREHLSQAFALSDRDLQPYDRSGQLPEPDRHGRDGSRFIAGTLIATTDGIWRDAGHDVPAEQQRPGDGLHCLDFLQLKSLLSLRTTKLSSNQLVHVFTLQHLQVIIQASDEYWAWDAQDKDQRDDNPPFVNLHFMSIGMPATFSPPALFKTIKLTVDPNFHAMYG